MKVIIEGRALAAATGGVRQYVKELLRQLQNQTSVELELLLTAAVNDPSLFNVEQRIVPLKADWRLPMWLQWQVPRALEGTGVDLVHFTKVDVPTALKMPIVATIYDVIPLLLPETQSFARRYYWPGAFRRAMAKSSHIFTISEASKHHLVERLGASPEEITVTPLAVDRTHFYKRSEQEVAVMKEKRNLQNPYILFVGTRDKRKNVWALLSAWRSLHKEVPHTLIVVGRQAEQSDETEDLVAEWGLEDRVQFWTDVSYEELPVVYSGAELFVWPSIIEGWGLPPQEAMACGVPVIVSDGEPMQEVVGSAGEIVPLGVNSLTEAFENEDFARALADRMRMVLSDTKKQEQMRQGGLAWVSRNSWEAVAKATVEGYKKALL